MRDLKPGDLVRLKAWYPSATGVAVSWGRPGVLGLLDVKRFDTGTPALLLQTDEVEFRKDHHSVAFILIEGRVGWVQRLQSLTGVIEVDLDAPLSADDE